MLQKIRVVPQIFLRLAKNKLSVAVSAALIAFSLLNLALASAASPTIIAVIPGLGGNNNYIVLDETANLAYTVSETASTLTVIDTNTNMVVRTVSLGFNGYNLGFNKVTKQLYIGTISDNLLRIFDIATDTIVGTLTVGGRPDLMAINYATNRLYTGNFNDGTISVINLTNNSTVTTIDTGLGGVRIWGLAVNETTNQVYSLIGNPAVSMSLLIIDGATNTTLNIPMPTFSIQIVVNPLTNRLYISNPVGNYVMVLDGSNNSLITNIPATWAYGLALDTINNRLLALGFQGDVVTEIDITNNSVVGTVGVPWPVAGVVHTGTKRAYVVARSALSVYVISELDPPNLSKTFSPPTIKPGETSTLTFNLSNPNSNETLKNIAFADALPASLQIASPSALVNNCGGSLINDSTTITLTNVSVNSNQACSLSVNVTGSTLGTFTNTISTIGYFFTAAATNAQATLTVSQPSPTATVANVSQAEGNSGATAFTFNVNLNMTSTLPITLSYSTSDGSATVADGDYTATSGTLTFAPGETSKTIRVAVNGDSKPEADETFSLNLTNPQNVIVGTPVITGTILNDDGAPNLAIADVSQAEGNSGTTSFNFAVTLGVASGLPITVNYTTANGTAQAGSDYAATSGTLTFAPGETSKTIRVAVNGDMVAEPDETFLVALANPVNAGLGRAQAIGTILNDDKVFSLSINNVSVTEGNKDTTKAIFTVRLSEPAATTVTVAYATADSTATVADKDYQATNGTLTFAPGVVEQTITVLVNGDTKDEGSETFFVNLSNPVGAILAVSRGVGTILNDDGAPASAELVAQLRVTPDREFNLTNPDDLLTYRLVIKNVGDGATASRPVVRFPLDNNLVVGYATFEQAGAYYEKTVTDTNGLKETPLISAPYAQLRLPLMLPGDTVTATLVFRAASDSKVGNVISTRLVVLWDNLSGKNYQRYSNLVRLKLGNSSHNDSDGLVQLWQLKEARQEDGQAVVRIWGDIYAPGERVYLWYTDAAGKSVELGYLYADDYSGELSATLKIANWQSGQTYNLAGWGARSGIIGGVAVTLEAVSANAGQLNSTKLQAPTVNTPFWLSKFNADK